MLEYDATHVSAQGAGRPYRVVYLDGPERGRVMWELESEFDRAQVVVDATLGLGERGTAAGVAQASEEPSADGDEERGGAPSADGDEEACATGAARVRAAAAPLAAATALAHRSKRPQRRSASAASSASVLLGALGRGGDVTMRSFRALWDAMSWECKAPYLHPADADGDGADSDGGGEEGWMLGRRGDGSASGKGRGEGGAKGEQADAPPRRSPRVTRAVASAERTAGAATCLRGDMWHHDIAPALIELQDRKRVVASRSALAASSSASGRRKRRAEGRAPAAAPPVHQLIPLRDGSERRQRRKHSLSPPPPPPLEPPPQSALRPVNATSAALRRPGGSLAIVPQDASPRARELAQGWLLYVSDGGRAAGDGPGPGAATGAYCIDASPYYDDGLVFRRCRTPCEGSRESGAVSGAPSAIAFIWYGDEGRWFVRANAPPRPALLVPSSAEGAAPSACVVEPTSRAQGAPYLLRSQPGCGARPPVGLRWWRRDEATGVHTVARDVCVEVLPRSFASPVSAALTLSALYFALHVARVPSLSTLRARARARRVHLARAARAQKQKRKLHAKMLRRANRAAAGGRKRKRKHRGVEGTKAKKARAPRAPKVKKKKKLKPPRVPRVKKPRVKKGPNLNAKASMVCKCSECRGLKPPLEHTVHSSTSLILRKTLKREIKWQVDAVAMNSVMRTVLSGGIIPGARPYIVMFNCLNDAAVAAAIVAKYVQRRGTAPRSVTAAVTVYTRSSSHAMPSRPPPRVPRAFRARSAHDPRAFPRRRYCEAHGGNFWSGAEQKSLLATCAEYARQLAAVHPTTGKVKRCRCAVCKGGYVQRKEYMKHFKVGLKEQVISARRLRGADVGFPLPGKLPPLPLPLSPRIVAATAAVAKAAAGAAAGAAEEHAAGSAAAPLVDVGVVV